MSKRSLGGGATRETFFSRHSSPPAKQRWVFVFCTFYSLKIAWQLGGQRTASSVFCFCRGCLKTHYAHLNMHNLLTGGCNSASQQESHRHCACLIAFSGKQPLNLSSAAGHIIHHWCCRYRALGGRDAILDLKTKPVCSGFLSRRNFIHLSRCTLLRQAQDLSQTLVGSLQRLERWSQSETTNLG